MRHEGRVGRTGRRAALVAGASVAVLVMGGVGAAGAASAPQVSQAAAVRSFDIPAQSLAGALTLFGDQAGVQIAAESAVVAGRAAPAVSGAMAPEEALRRLLAGSGLLWRFTDATTVVLEKPAAAGGVTVADPVTVEAAPLRQSPTGPVAGFVAERSITATKTDTPIVETPQAIAVVTADQMDKRAVQNVGQALGYAAGVVAQPSGADARYDVPQIRGFSVAEGQYLNGLRIMRGFGAPSVEVYGLERIEALRGPSSVLYGQASPGGLLNMISKRPVDEAFGEITVEAGSEKRFQGGFDLGGPIADDLPLTYRLTGVVRDSGTQMDHIDDDRYFLAPAVTWKSDDQATRVTLLTQVQHDRSGSPLGLPLAGTLYDNPLGKLSRDLYLGEPDFDESARTQWSLGYEAERRVNDQVTLRQNARYMALDWDYQGLYYAGLASDNRTAYRGTSYQNEDLDTVNVDTQGEVTLGTGPLAHTVLGGVDVRYFDAHTKSLFGSAPSIDIYNPVYGQAIAAPTGSATDKTQRMTQVGLYVQDQIRWHDWQLTAGLRHDVATIRTKIKGKGGGKQDDAATTGRVGLSYIFDFGLVPYLSYSTSFDPQTGTAAPQRGGGNFDSSQGRQYEAGMKFQPKGYNSFLAASLFDLTQTNVKSSDPLYSGYSVQTGEITVQGFELEALASLYEGLNLSASYTLQEAEITGGAASEKGNRPANVPSQTASLWVDYTIQPQSAVGKLGLAGIGLGGGVRYVGERYGDNANTIKLESNTVFDAEIGYERETWKVALNLNNLTDEDTIGTCTAFGCYYGDGRTVVGKLTYRW
ncbi:TonB-dependent siderophore receptor [Rhodospirillum rubrum ATCC 11170]|uniref:TonB-dependent siderophore receptor n=3 Tax=Rhodospirillum rubrum TaxID=1085 RepID=Q2RRQ0_RHORT|nr:TonB-dependent siderophore receptor [Rhodospirillum rubrum]ABC23195.1 TonB-dependent siderophore receptor [Rhodospirillum rubrum ATCC 11170]